jgi:hypothetical protein
MNSANGTHHETISGRVGDHQRSSSSRFRVPNPLRKLVTLENSD